MIHVIDDWYIDADDLQYQSFQLKTNKKTGKQFKSGTNYHGTIERAIMRVIQSRKRYETMKLSGDILTSVKMLEKNENAMFAEIMENLKG